MAFAFNSMINNEFISSSKSIQEEEKSQIYCKTTLAVSIPCSLWTKQELLSNNDYVPTTMNSSQDVFTLQSDNEKLEQELKVLESRTLFKQCKVEDLRQLVQRISDEDHCFDRSIDHRRYFNFLRQSKSSSSQSQCQTQQQPKKVRNSLIKAMF